MIDIVSNRPGVHHPEISIQRSTDDPMGKDEFYEGMTSDSARRRSNLEDMQVHSMTKAEALLRSGSAGQAAAIVTDVRERAFEDTDPSKAQDAGCRNSQQAAVTDELLVGGIDENQRSSNF
ncbi:MAG: hypothetical protein U5K69_30290 [Balneolaceae bacterium]|nr:hypothetical protein [Balneolaceae bacterium]